MTGENIQGECGSFRDPSGYVFYYQGGAYRALDADSFTLIQQLVKENLLDSLVQKGHLIPTQIITQNDPVYKDLRVNLPQEEFFLQHFRVPTISYPYEWSFSMLADAAKLQLLLQLELLEKGYSLKDASSFNVQFIHCKPVFIDILSIEKLRLKEVWIAYGQFCQMYLYPLLLKRYKNIGLKNSFLNNLNGLHVDEVYAIFGLLGSLRPALVLDVLLQYFFQKAASKKTPALKKRLEQEGSSTTSQTINLKRMLRKINKLTSSSKPIGQWIDYIETNTYSPEAESAKTHYLEEFMRNYSPKTVLDLGCNTGRYSLIASECGADVIAVDSDHDCIDQLYQHAKNTEAKILPLWIDIANPTPAMGFCHQERKSFMERMHADAVFALALIHHLLITSRVPLENIRDFFYCLAKTYVIVEFIGRQDGMFQKLLALREDIYKNINRDSFLATFSQKFDLVSQLDIAGTHRTLFTFRKK